MNTLENAIELIKILTDAVESLSDGFEQLASMVPFKENHQKEVAEELEKIMLASLTVTNMARKFVNEYGN